MTYQDFQSGVDDHGRRLDRVVRRLLPDVRLGEVYALLRKGRIKVNGRKRKASYRIAEGDSLQVDEKAGGVHRGAEESARTARTARKHGHTDRNENAGSEQFDLPSREYQLDRHIVFENDHLLGFNKPRGVQMHGSRSLDNWVRKYLSHKVNRSLSFRPGPVHRLDRNTTGLVFFGKTTHGSRRLSEHMKAATPRKIYLTVLDGSLRRPELWRNTLARDGTRRMTVRMQARRKNETHGTANRSASVGDSTTGTASVGEATTAVYPILWTQRATLALCVIRGGKTHQIRAQAALHGHPLSGDRKYGGSHDRSGYVLHSLAFLMPEQDESLGLQHAYAEPTKDILTRIESRFGPFDLEHILQSVNEAAEIL